ncbi:hypothetical protein EJ07DRAFT_154431 [Lizonia empirigonia]|nr:hypothetical protein EJ07DRAFT_154431 [Lizonia empirigonia]
MGVATATSKMLDKWWNRDIVENSDPQPTSRNGLVLQEVQQGMPPKSAKDAVEDAHQRRIEVIQEHQRQMQEVEAGKERRKIQEKLRKRRETSVAIATQVKLGRFSAGCQTRQQQTVLSSVKSGQRREGADLKHTTKHAATQRPLFCISLMGAATS